MMARWGELPMDPETEPGIAAIEREQITKPRPMELDGPPLHQPVKMEQTLSYDVPIECTFGDTLVSHSIALNQHAKKLRTIMANLQQQIENPQKTSENEDEVPFFPTLPVIDLTEKKVSKNNITLDECFVRFRQGKGEAQPEINDQLAKKILRKALAVMCAHSGFDSTTESVLETLVDVLSEYYLKIMHLLRAAVDREALAKGTSFPDVLEQVFYEMGIGSMRNLGLFYKTRIIDYHCNLLETCKQLNEDYKRIKFPEAPKEAEEAIPITTEEVVPQIHFPTTEEHDETHPESTLHLDEFQNLQATFEQESANDVAEEEASKAEQSARADNILLSLPSSMATLDPDEEIVNVIDSPIHTHENESSHAPQLTTLLEQQHSPIGIGMKVLKTKRKFELSN